MSQAKANRLEHKTLLEPHNTLALKSPPVLILLVRVNYSVLATGGTGHERWLRLAIVQRWADFRFGRSTLRSRANGWFSCF